MCSSKASRTGIAALITLCMGRNAAPSFPPRIKAVLGQRRSILLQTASPPFDSGRLCKVRSSEASRTGIAALITQCMGCNAALFFCRRSGRCFLAADRGHFWTTPLDSSANGPPLSPSTPSAGYGRASAALARSFTRAGDGAGAPLGQQRLFSPQRRHGPRCRIRPPDDSPPVRVPSFKQGRGAISPAGRIASTKAVAMICPCDTLRCEHQYNISMLLCPVVFESSFTCNTILFRWCAGTWSAASHAVLALTVLGRIRVRLGMRH